MKILGIDSSSKSASVAVTDDNKLLAETFINTGLTHSQTLIPMIQETINNAELDVKDIDLVAVTNGPGSFTGVRIGIASVKGLCFTNDIPCVAVSTLKALAVNVRHFTGIICSVMDARCQQVYFAAYESDGKNIIQLVEDSAISLDELKNFVKSQNKNVIFVGDGADLCYNYTSECENTVLCDYNSKFVRGSSVCICAENEKQTSSEALLPQYLRLPQAQRNLKKKEVND